MNVACMLNDYVLEMPEHHIFVLVPYDGSQGLHKANMDTKLCELALRMHVSRKHLLSEPIPLSVHHHFAIRHTSPFYRHPLCIAKKINHHQRTWLR